MKTMSEKTAEKKYSGYGYHGGGRKPVENKKIFVSTTISGTPEEIRDILTRLLQGKGEAAHEAAVAANVAMLMRLHGEEDLKANAQKVLDVLRSGAAYDRVTALAARG